MCKAQLLIVINESQLPLWATKSKYEDKLSNNAHMIYPTEIYTMDSKSKSSRI